MQTVGGMKDQTVVESGLADYYPYGFLSSNDPALVTSDPDLAFINDEDHLLANTGGDGPSIVEMGHYWAAAFWKCRQKLDQSLADGILLRAWKRSYEDGGSDPVKKFQAAIVDAANSRGNEALCFVEEFRKRKMPPVQP
jgi:hypothetical protein